MKRYPKAGARISVRGAGRHGVGTVRELPPITLDAYKQHGLVVYRCDFNKGEHTAKLELCRDLDTIIRRRQRAAQKDYEAQEAIHDDD